MARDHGLAEVHRGDGDHPRKDVASKNVFEGLTANRRSCVECGYTEAVMHFSFDNLTLPVPRAVSRHKTLYFHSPYFQI